jgi:photosystem II stability/assembly factor-like uncharacterized protein
MDNYLWLATDDGLAVGRFDGRSWRVVDQSLSNHRLTSVIAREGVILAGSTAGLLRWDDGGRQWQVADRGLGPRHVRWLAYHPDVSDLEFAGTEPAAIFVSRDGATTWQECADVAALRETHGWFLPYSPESGCVRGFAFAGKRVYAAVEVGGILVSDDEGGSWRLASGSDGRPFHGSPAPGFIHPDVHMVALHPDRPETIYAPTGGGLYVSEDSGESWLHLHRCYCRAVWIDPQDPRHLAVGPAETVDRNGRIKESHDGGRSWQSIDEGTGAPWPNHMVERFFQLNDWLLAVLSNGKVLASVIGLWQWEPILTEQNGVRCLTSMA